MSRHVRGYVVTVALSLTLLVLPGIYETPPAFAQPIPVPGSGGGNIPGVGIPFGGLVATTLLCPCNGGIMATVGPPTPTIWYSPPLKSYSFAMTPMAVRPGMWNLGLAAPGAECLTAVKCAPAVPPPIVTLMPQIGVTDAGTLMLGTSI